LHHIDFSRQRRYLVGQTFQLCFLGGYILSRRLQGIDGLPLKRLKIPQRYGFLTAIDHRGSGWVSGNRKFLEQTVVVEPKVCARGGDDGQQNDGYEDSRGSFLALQGLPNLAILDRRSL
jgi:hypothetical protein